MQKLGNFFLRFLIRKRSTSLRDVPLHGVSNPACFLSGVRIEADMRWNVILRFSDFHAGVCRLRDYSALRASPSGSPCGRSTSLRDVVEPALFDVGDSNFHR